MFQSIVNPYYIYKYLYIIYVNKMNEGGIFMLFYLVVILIVLSPVMLFLEKKTFSFEEREESDEDEANEYQKLYNNLLTLPCYKGII